MQRFLQQTKLNVRRTEAHGSQAPVFRFEVSLEPIASGSLGQHVRPVCSATGIELG